MDDLMHKLVSGALSGGLIALVGGLSVLVRRRRVARAEAAAPAPVEDLSQTLLRQAQEADRSREALAAQAAPPRRSTRPGRPPISGAGSPRCARDGSRPNGSQP